MGRVIQGRRGKMVLVFSAVVALLTAVTVLAVTGSREPASALKLLNGDAWLTNARTGTASHVNGYSGKVDSQVGIGAADDPFQIVERPDGAYALDLRTGRLVRLDSATLNAGKSAAARVPGAPAGLQVVAATDATWIVDTTSGVVQQVDPSTLAAIGPQVPLGAATGRATSDDAGTLWVPVPSRGRVDAITVGGELTTHVFGKPGDHLQVADTSSGIWAVDSNAGHARSLSMPQAHAVTFPPVTNGASPIVGADPSAPYVVVVENLTAASPGNGVRDTSQVLVIDTTRSSLSSVTSPAAAPATQVVVSGDRAYMLDSAADQLQTVNLTQVNSLPPVAVPPGSNQLVSKDQLVFVNASDSPQAVVVNASGHVTSITKYTPAPPVPARGHHDSQGQTISAPPSNQAGGLVTPTPPSGNQQGFNPPPPVTTPFRTRPSPPPIPPTPVRPIPTTPPRPHVIPPRPHVTPPPATTTTVAPTPTTTVPHPTPTTVPPSVPSAPRITGVTAGYEEVTVTWRPPATLGGSAVKYYTVVAGSASVQVAGTLTSKVVTVKGDGVRVCPTVSATNSTGTSTRAGGSKCGTTTSLAQVTGLRVTASGTSVTASWNRVAHATGYKVSLNGGGATKVSTNSYKFSGSSWNSYTVTVAATDGVGTGPWSSPGGPAYTSGSVKTGIECQYTLDGWIGVELGSSCSDPAAYVKVGPAPFKAFPGQSSIANEQLCTGWNTASGSNEYLVENSSVNCLNSMPQDDPQHPPTRKMWVASKSAPGLTEVCVYRGIRTAPSPNPPNPHNVWELWPRGHQPSGMSSNGSCFYTPQ